MSKTTIQIAAPETLSLSDQANYFQEFIKAAIECGGKLQIDTTSDTSMPRVIFTFPDELPADFRALADSKRRLYGPKYCGFPVPIYAD